MCLVSRAPSTLVLGSRRERRRGSGSSINNNQGGRQVRSVERGGGSGAHRWMPWAGSCAADGAAAARGAVPRWHLPSRGLGWALLRPPTGTGGGCAWRDHRDARNPHRPRWPSRPGWLGQRHRAASAVRTDRFTRRIRTSGSAAMSAHSSGTPLCQGAFGVRVFRRAGGRRSVGFAGPGSG